MLNKHIVIGRASEFLAAYLLELSGLRTTHVDLPHDDLWCSKPDGTLIRVQVKARTKVDERPSRRGSSAPHLYSFPTSNGSLYGGVFLFIAQDLGLMIARSWDDVPPKTIRIARKDFTHEAQVASIKREFNL